MEVISNLKSEVFLPNDIIVKAGTPGDCMYFLETGTVSVLTRNGKEVIALQKNFLFIFIVYNKQICHLQDGAYFGEVSLIIKDQKRIATVVAIEICEVYKLDRKKFRQCFKTCPHVYKKMEELAEKRLEITVVLEELYKKYLADRSDAHEKGKS